MRVPAVARRGLVALMNGVPASAAGHFDTSARVTLVGAFLRRYSLDYMYVTDWSLMNNLKLTLRTVPAVLRAHNAC